MLKCRQELEVREQLERGRWPEGVPAELRHHVAACRRCAEIVELMGLTAGFRAARVTAMRQAPLPPPGILWWRAQLRRRHAAVERMGKPLLGAQVFALLMLVSMVAVLAVSEARSLHLDAPAPAIASADWKTMLNLTYLIPGGVLLVLLGSVVIYLASEKQ